MRKPKTNELKPDHLGHVHLKVSDLKRAENFYTNFFGLNVTEKIENHFVFLSLGKHHHDVALMNIGSNAKRPDENETGLFHFAFEVKTKKDFATFFKKFKDAGLDPSTVDYGISLAMYVKDPDDNVVEIYIDTRERIHKWEGKTRLLLEEEIISHLK